MDGKNTATGGGSTGAEGATEQNNRQGQQGGEGAATETNETKTYTAEELQAETDRRVTEAVKTATAKANADFEKRLQEEHEKWEKQSKMSAAEREAAARKEEQAQFEAERQKFNAEKLEYECTKLLAADGLPVDFAKQLTGADMDATKANVAAFKDAFSKAVEAAVTERMKGKAPSGGGTPPPTDPFLAGFGG